MLQYTLVTAIGFLLILSKITDLNIITRHFSQRLIKFKSGHIETIQVILKAQKTRFTTTLRYPKSSAYGFCNQSQQIRDLTTSTSFRTLTKFLTGVRKIVLGSTLVVVLLFTTRIAEVFRVNITKVVRARCHTCSRTSQI